jgi:amidase
MKKIFFVIAMILALSFAPSSAWAAPATLNDLILEAKAVNLSVYPAKYADIVAHTLAKAEKTAASLTATDEQRNIARLELQIALDTLVIDLQLVTVPDMQGLVKAGKLTYAKLTQMYLTRIELYDKNLNKLNAVRALNPDALANAAACDAAFAQNASVANGMFGIPVMLKDNINFMGLPTTAGSIALADNYAPYDAPLVTNLKRAGAIILGKLNMTEFAHGVSNNSTNVNGFSSLGRRVYSAYRPNALTAHGSTLSRLDPSGSSSGSGVAASAALAAVTIGTETNGSIISPSQSNFHVGIKPTVGIISRHGVIPLNILQDTAGPIVRNVTDAAILMNATYGYDPNDTETEGIEKTGLTGFDFNESLKPTFLQGKRIGVMSVPAATAAARPAFDAALKALETAGARLVYQLNGNVLPSIASPTAPSSTTFQFKVSLPIYLATLSPDYKWYNKKLEDVYAYMAAEFQANPGLFRDHLGTNLDINKIGESNNYVLDEQTLATWAEHRSSDIRQCRSEGIDRRLIEYNLDGLLGSGSMTAQTARGGYPHVTIPIFRTNSTQLTGGSHMYFAGTAFSEPVLIAAAYVAEQATKARDDSAPGLAEKTALGETITTARALSSEDRAPFQDIYQLAVETYTNDFATQMHVDKAEDALRTAMIKDEFFTVVFVDWDSKILATQSVKSGTSATAPSDPTRKGYIFIGWDKEFLIVTGDMTITAQYEEEDTIGCNAVNYYLVFALFGIIPFVLARKKQ